MNSRYCFLYLLILLPIIHSCSSGKSKSKTDIKNETALNSLAKKYSAEVDWDTSYVYTATFQEDFIGAKKLMLFKGRIFDIFKVDSIYFMKILDEREDSYQYFLAVCSITKEQYDKVYDEKTTNIGGFILQISKIKTSDPSIKTDEYQEEDGGSVTYSHLSDDKDRMITTFYGKVVDFQLNAKKE